MEIPTDSDDSSFEGDDVDKGPQQTPFTRQFPSLKKPILSREDVYFGTQPYLRFDRTRAQMATFPYRTDSARNSAQISRMSSTQNGDPHRASSDEFGDRAAVSGPDLLLPTALPNPTMEFDVRSLNLHLSARVHEVLACAESMWEWVSEYQARCRALIGGGNSPFSYEGKLLPLQSISTGRDGVKGGMMLDPDPGKKAIREMTRADFDLCLSRFEMYVQNYDF